jgi:uncharacterized protein (DUF697 family)/tellurite resistance protein
MDIDLKEATACVRALFAVAKADGRITDDEMAALSSAIEALPASGDLQRYLAESPNFDELLSEVKTPAAREQLWQSAYAMVHADGTASPDEVRLLDKMRSAFQLPEANVSTTTRLMDEAKDTLLPSHIKPVTDPELRQKEIGQDVMKYSVLSAVLGAFPVPGIAIATDLAIVALQLKLVRDVGQYWGHKVDREAAKTLLGGLGLGTGARIAVSNLAKVVPVWGSAFGATSAFATTWALGKIANRYFESGRTADLKELKKEMKTVEKEGKEAYAKQKELIETRRRETEAQIKTLNDQRKAGTLSQPEYEAKVAALAG